MHTETLTTARVVDASTLGWAPGVWPCEARVGRNNTLFTSVRVERDGEGGIVAVHYVADGGATLVVLND